MMASWEDSTIAAYCRYASSARCRSVMSSIIASAKCGLPGRIAGHGNSEPPPDDPAILAHEPFFHLVMIGLAGEQPVKLFLLFPVVTRVGEVPAGDLLKFLGAVTEHLLKRAVGFDDFSLQILDGDAGAGPFKHRPKAGFTVAERRFGAPFFVFLIHFAQGALDGRNEFCPAAVCAQSPWRPAS